MTEKGEGYQVVSAADVARDILDGAQDRVPPARPSVGKWQVVSAIEDGKVVIDSKADRALHLDSEGAFRWFIDTLRRAGLNLGWTMAPVVQWGAIQRAVSDFYNAYYGEGEHRGPEGEQAKAAMMALLEAWDHYLDHYLD